MGRGAELSMTFFLAFQRRPASQAEKGVMFSGYGEPETFNGLGLRERGDTGMVKRVCVGASRLAVVVALGVVVGSGCGGSSGKHSDTNPRSLTACFIPTK